MYTSWIEFVKLRALSSIENKHNRKKKVRYFCTSRYGETIYDILGIAAAMPSDIKKVYKEMARKYHPDISPPDQVEEYTNKFIIVNQAYEMLSDP